MSRDPGEVPFDVLIVDDEAFVRETLALYLEGEGCRIHAASGGEEALALAARVDIEAAIVDIRMPGMDGLTLLSELKRRHPDVEVLMATGFQSLETAVEAMRRGACDYITKPITDLENDLLRFVLRAVERRRLRLRNRELSHGLQRALDELGGVRAQKERGAAALEAIEELGRRTMRATRHEDAIEALIDILPRVAPEAGAVVYLVEAGRPVAVRTLGAPRDPLAVPPLVPPTEAGAPRWVERASESAPGETETWFPLSGAGDLRGWILVTARSAKAVPPAARIAVRALADHFTLTLAALSGASSRSVDTAT